MNQRYIYLKRCLSVEHTGRPAGSSRSVTWRNTGAGNRVRLREKVRPACAGRTSLSQTTASSADLSLGAWCLDCFQGENRAVCLNEDSLGVAAHDQLSHPGPTPQSEDDQGGIGILLGLQDQVGGIMDG